jgi:hypothetical protein
MRLREQTRWRTNDLTSSTSGPILKLPSHDRSTRLDYMSLAMYLPNALRWKCLNTRLGCSRNNWRRAPNPAIASVDYHH